MTVKMVDMEFLFDQSVTSVNELEMIWLFEQVDCFFFSTNNLVF